MSAPDITQLYGKHWFVWYDNQSGGVQGIIDTCRATGAHGVLVKAADGIDVWPQFVQDAPALKAAGLLVGAWSYVYADLDAQAQAHALCVALSIADYLVVDAEVEYEIATGAASATALGAAIRALAPSALIGYTSFGAPKLHPQFPYAAFAAWTDFVIPQVYWSDFAMSPQAALDNAIAGLSPLHKRIFPAGQAYPQATPAEIAQFSAACAARWINATYWWDIQSATAEIKAAVGQTEVYVPQTGKPIPRPVAAPTYAEGYAAGIAAAIKQLEGMTK